MNHRSANHVKPGVLTEARSATSLYRSEHLIVTMAAQKQLSKSIRFQKQRTIPAGDDRQSVTLKQERALVVHI